VTPDWAAAAHCQRHPQLGPRPIIPLLRPLCCWYLPSSHSSTGLIGWGVRPPDIIHLFANTPAFSPYSTLRLLKIVHVIVLTHMNWTNGSSLSWVDKLMIADTKRDVPPQFV
jgi:hypothetical protein